MCGIVGYIDLSSERPVDEKILQEMMAAISHRGPDSSGMMVTRTVAFGCQRLAIMDVAGGDQPLFNEDKTIGLVCNGEIFNYDDLISKHLRDRHRLRTGSDCEVIVHLYEEFGDGLLSYLNGQFSFALYDHMNNKVLLARDHFGIIPLYYTIVDRFLIFASEIKALLKHPSVRAEVDLIGLDQIVCFPGLVSPRTLFAGIRSLPPGCRLLCQGGAISVRSYWDLIYPDDVGLSQTAKIADYEEELLALFRQSVRRRLRADVPIGVYISGGLDSSMIAAMTRQLRTDEIRSYSITFCDKNATEEKYQRIIATAIKSNHREIRFDTDAIIQRFNEMIYHAESPVKESYNTCVLALSEETHRSGVKVVLGGEGADELFGGYPGYRFDALSSKARRKASADELRLRNLLWGDASIGYERCYSEFSKRRQQLYSDAMNEFLRVDNALSERLVDDFRVTRKHPLNQRSYLDCHLRLADHLLAEHGDHMLMANGVEGRYPFLDLDLVEFACKLPVSFKVQQFEEKFILKKIASGLVPEEIVRREKFGFFAPSGPALIRSNVEWVQDLLSCDLIKRHGYFCPRFVEQLKTRYLDPRYNLDPRFEDDFLLIILSFNIMYRLFFE
jgi:asparagine synthase (glutamine-hydrolysing)